MESDAMLGALNEYFSTPIKYYSRVTHYHFERRAPRAEEKVLCLGEHALFVLDVEMQNMESEIFYAHIFRVVRLTDKENKKPNRQKEEKKDEEEVEPYSAMRIEMGEDRDPGIPKMMTIMSHEIDLFLKYLQCCWETDYMWRTAKIKKLKIEKEVFNKKHFKIDDKTKRMEELNIYPNPTGINVYIVTDYKFLNFSTLRYHTLKNQFIGEEDIMLSFKVSNMRLVEFLTDDIRTKAEVKLEDKIIATGRDYFFLKNDPYLKRRNLVSDRAEWKCWEILARTETEAYSVFLLHRKFIPPFMDKGQEIMIECVGANTELVRKIAKLAADSLFSAETLELTNTVYTNIVQQRSDALLMSEEAAAYYKRHLNIKTVAEKYAYRFIHSLCKKLNRRKRDKNLKNLIKKIEHNFQESESGLQDVVDPTDIITSAINEQCVEFSPEGIRVWQSKLMRYLVFCINGGMFQSRFTLSHITTSIWELEYNESEILRKIIAMLLDIRRSDYKKRPPTEDNQNLSSMVSIMLESRDEIWLFNETVMNNLIETGYMKRELELSGVSVINGYADLLKFIIHTPRYGLKLKSNACSFIIGWDLPSLSGFSTMIEDLMVVYEGRNYSLAAAAGFTLYHLFRAKENKARFSEIKEKVFRRIKTIKDERVLLYSLMILHNFSNEPSRRREISNETLTYIKNIITGPNIEMFQWSSKVISYSMKLLKELIAYSRAQDELNGDIDFFRSIENNHISREDEAAIHTCEFLQKYIEKSIDKKLPNGESSRKMIIEGLIPALLHNLEYTRHDHVLTAKLKFLKQLSEDKSFMYLFEENGARRKCEIILSGKNHSAEGTSLAKDIRKKIRT